MVSPPRPKSCNREIQPRVEGNTIPDNRTKGNELINQQSSVTGRMDRFLEKNVYVSRLLFAFFHNAACMVSNPDVFGEKRNIGLLLPGKGEHKGVHSKCI